jgi:pimeloyl-ACP methyl ester carboxylesterase
LAVPGFRAALLSLPLPTEQLKGEPLLLAAHGAGDSAHSQCEVWREILGSCGAILCISGTPIGPGDSNGYFFRNHMDLEKEVLSAVEALRTRFGESIDVANSVYGSYSQGGTMGALMLPAHGALFSRLILVEGGAAEWTVRRGKQFAESGGSRVLFVCGTKGCNRSAAHATQTLAESGLAIRHLDVPGGGHAYWGSVAEAVAKAWPWVVEHDPRWH